MSDADAKQITAFLREAVGELASRQIPEDDEAFRSADLLQDIGCDSLDLINLLFRIEQRYKIKIPEPDIDEQGLTRVGRLADYLAAQPGRA